MRIKETVCALIDAYSTLAENCACSERGTMETLLDIFEPEVLDSLGYGDRVRAYFQEYGAGDEMEGTTPPDDGPRQRPKPQL